VLKLGFCFLHRPEFVLCSPPELNGMLKNKHQNQKWMLISKVDAE